MPDVLLVRHFVRRFIENDFISPEAGRSEALSIAGGMMVGAGLCLSVYMAAPYQFFMNMPAGIASLQSLDDRYVFVSVSMLILALIAVGQWDALALDARDTVLLGVLPISRLRIVRAKLAAVGLLALAADLGWNIPSTLMRVVAVPTKLPIGLSGLAQLTFAHFIVTMTAGAFGFFGIVSIREGLAAVLGQRRYAKVSPVVQALLLAAVIIGLLLVPESETQVSRQWFARQTSATRAWPPLWFVAAHEVVAGDVFDSLPRTAPRFLEGRAHSATAAYREMRPMFRVVGQRSVVALMLVAGFFLLAQGWNNRRLPEPVSPRPGRVRWPVAPIRWILGRASGRSGTRQAGFWFTWQTLPRSSRHRSVIAVSFALGVTLLVLTSGGVGLTAHVDIASISTRMLASEFLLVGTVVIGIRRAADLSADVRACVTFNLASQGDWHQYLAGVKRAGWVFGALPLAATFFLWHAMVVGVLWATLHATVMGLWSFVWLGLLLRTAPPLAFGVPDAEDATMARSAGRIAALIITALLLAAVEHQASSTGSGGYVLLITALAVTSIAASSPFARRGIDVE